MLQLLASNSAPFNINVCIFYPCTIKQRTTQLLFVMLEGLSCFLGRISYFVTFNVTFLFTWTGVSVKSFRGVCVCVFNQCDG